MLVWKELPSLVTESYNVYRILSGMWERSIREVGELVDFSAQARTRGQRIELARRAEPTGVLMGWRVGWASATAKGLTIRHRLDNISVQYDTEYITVQNTERGGGWAARARILA